jgi:hypothetical protein
LLFPERHPFLDAANDAIGRDVQLDDFGGSESLSEPNDRF